MATQKEWLDYLKVNNPDLTPQERRATADAYVKAGTPLPAKNKTVSTNTSTGGFGITGLSGFSTGSGLGDIDVASQTYDVSGMNLPVKFADPTKVTGTQLYDALNKVATSNPSAWLPIKYALAQSNYYSGNVDFSNPNFQSEDKTALTHFLSNLTISNSNLAQGEKPTPVISFLSQQQKLSQMYGGAGARQTIQKVTVPNELDLKKIADNAFRSALGKPATDAQQKAFAKSFQDSVMAVARASAAQTAAPTMPKVPTTAQIQGAAPATPQAGMESIQKAAATPAKAGGVILKQIQEQPNAQVMAEQAAIQAAPASAASQNVSNALDAMFKSLARNSQ